MKFKIFLFCFISLLILMSSNGYAQNRDLNGSFTMDIFDKYVWRGTTIKTDAVLQSSVEMSYVGLRFNYWYNYHFSTENVTDSSYSISYSFTINKLTVEPGNLYYELDGVNDTEELFVSLSYDTHLSPTIIFYYDWKEGEGAFTDLSLSYSVNVFNDIFFNVNTLIGTNIKNKLMGLDKNGDAFTDLYYADLSAVISIPFARVLELSLKAGYSIPLSDNGEFAINAVNKNADAKNDSSKAFYTGLLFSLSP